MCNRYVAPDAAAIERFWRIGARSPAPQWGQHVHPRALGPFLRAEGDDLALVVGQWALVPHFAESAKPPYSTNNARAEEVSRKPSFREPWKRGQRCIIPAMSFDEPCWETGRNMWWRFHRADGEPWGLAGLWNTWRDRQTGELVESYTMLTLNADEHPLMRRMHKPDPALPADGQDKRSVVAIEHVDEAAWLRGSLEEASALLRLAPGERIVAGPAVRRAA